MNITAGEPFHNPDLELHFFLMGSLVFAVCYLSLLIVCDLVLRVRYVLNASSTHKYFTRLIKYLARMAFALAHTYGGLIVRIKNNLRGQLPPTFLVVCNHQSLADIPGLVCAFPDHDLKFIAKAALSKGFPVISFGLRMGRHASIDRRGSYTATFTELAKLMPLTAEGFCPVVFPEGTRSRTGDLLRFHSAAFRYVLEHERLPIVSVAVEGGFRIALARDLLRMKGRIYRLETLNIYPHPEGKHEAMHFLESIRAEISTQLAGWRS